MPLLRSWLPRAHAVRRTPGACAHADVVASCAAHASLETGGLASRAPRACHCCAASCLEPMRHGVRAARVHQLVASAPVCPVRAEAAWIMQPSALHGALRACRRLHATTWRGADARKRPPPCRMAARRARKRGAACGVGADSWTLCFVHQAARGRTTQPSVSTTAPPPLGVAPARASASHRRHCAARVRVRVRVLCAGHGVCWRHADERETPGVCHHHKETPLLQHPVHSAAASWGVTRLTAPCPGPPRPATLQPVAPCASAPPPRCSAQLAAPPCAMACT